MASGPIDKTILFLGVANFLTQFSPLYQQKQDKAGSSNAPADSSGKVIADWGNQIDNMNLALVQAIEEGDLGAIPQLNAIDTSQGYFTGLVDQWKFEGSLLAEGATGRDLTSNVPFDSYCTIRGKKFYSIGRSNHLDRAGTHDAVHNLPGAASIYFLVDIHQMPTADSALFLFGVPGSNAPGTNAQWGMNFDGGVQNMQSFQEEGAGVKILTEFSVIPSGIYLWTLTKSADLGGSTQTISMYLNGVLISASVENMPDDGGGTQEINIGQAISMLVGDAVVCNVEHDAATVALVAAQVGI